MPKWLNFLQGGIFPMIFKKPPNKFAFELIDRFSFAATKGICVYSLGKKLNAMFIAMYP